MWVLIFDQEIPKVLVLSITTNFLFYFFICWQCWFHVEGWKILKTSPFTFPPSPLSTRGFITLHFFLDCGSLFFLYLHSLWKLPIFVPLPLLFLPSSFISSCFSHCLPSLPCFLPSFIHPSFLQVFFEILPEHMCGSFLSAVMKFLGEMLCWWFWAEC